MSNLPATPRWTAVNQLVFSHVADPDDLTSLQAIHRQLLTLIKEKGPMNRFELVLLAMQEVETKQDIQRHITDMKRIALTESLILVQEPKDFLYENTPDFTGVSFSKIGGYCIRDEHGQEHGNFRTADEAIVAHQKHYSHIPQT